MTPRNLVTIAATTATALMLASCGGAVEEDASSVMDEAESAVSGGSSMMMESTMMEFSGMGGMETTMAGGDEVTVGGFAVETPNGEVTVPEVSVSPEEAEAYIADVQPIVEDSVRDISSLIEPEVSIENGNISLDLNVNSLEDAQSSIEEGAERLRDIQPPSGLEDVNEQLVQAYEDAVPAYQDVVDAAQSGDAQEITDAAQQSLQDIEGFNDEVDALLQDVQQAVDSQQQ